MKKVPNLPAIGKQLLFSATRTKNWFYKDTIVDYFKETRHQRIRQKNIQRIKRLPENFKSTIIQNGNVFETETVKFLRQELGEENWETICIDYRLAKSSELYHATIDAMKRGVPIIYQGVLHNYSNKTFGLPDLIIRSDWINRLVSKPVLTKEEEKVPAPGLGDEVDWHYRVIDIKCSTLPFASNGVNMVNSGSIPAYKGQVCIYNDALAEMQGFDPGAGYLLGKRWSQMKRSRGVTIDTKCNNCFDRYGVIDYKGYDEKYVEETKKSIAWLEDLTENAHDWQVFPPSNKYLYPNMKNKYDYPFHSEKKELAEQIGEITNIWYCGVEKRNRALEAGVTSWRDPKCTAELLGFKNPRMAKIVNTILKVNRDQEQLIYIDAGFLKSGLAEQPQEIEFYVDFETISNVVDQPAVPVNKDYNIVYMVGVGYTDPETDAWVYKDFTVSECTEAEEFRIMLEWVEYMYEVAGKEIGTAPLSNRIFHWSSIEHRLFNQKMNGVYQLTGWTDLCQVFMDTPIVPKGALSFGLKEVARAMYENRLIQSFWDTKNPCNNGLESMVIFKKIRDISKKEGKDINQVPLLKDIINYNELDCKVMWEIMGFLREEVAVVLAEAEAEVIDSILDYTDTSSIEIVDPPPRKRIRKD